MNSQRSAEIPVVEWPVEDGPLSLAEKRRVAGEVGEACRHSGYFFLGCHGVPDYLIAAAFDETRQFYARPQAQKNAFSCSTHSQFLGYRGLAAEKSRMHSGPEAC